MGGAEHRGEVTMEKPIEQRRNETLRTYSEDDVQGILERAFGLQGREFTHAHLVQMADELGITTEQLAEAEALWMAERDTLKERERFRAHRRGEFRQHLTAYVIVNGFLFLMNMLGTLIDVPPWIFLLPLLAWGMGLAFHAVDVFQKEEEEEEREFERWLARRERRLAKRAARRAKRLPQ